MKILPATKLLRIVLLMLLVAIAQPAISDTTAQGSEQEAEQLNQQAVQLYQQGKYQEALPLLQRTLEINEKVLGSEHERTAINLNNLGWLYEALGQYDNALPLYQRALTILEKTLGPEHENTAGSLNNLGELYRVLGQYDKALPLHQRALTILEKTLGPEHENTAASLNNLAMMYSNLGQYDKALPLHQRALGIVEKILGPEHEVTAASLNNLAMMYSNLGQYDRALPLCQRALTTHEKTLGPEHERTAINLNNLGWLYEALGQYDNALPLYQRALTILEKTLGPEHENTATSLNNLGWLYEALGQYDKALPLYQRAYRSASIARVPEILKLVQMNLGAYYAEQGDPAVAILYLKGAVNTMQGIRVQSRNLDQGLQQSLLQKNESVYNGLIDLLVDEGRLAEAQQVISMLKEDEYFDFIRDFSPGFYAGNYASWENFGKLYEQGAAAAATVTPKVQALADNLTHGIADRREQARALYHWVSRNIRYVLVSLGNGGMAPHSADSILDNHYGDCKDHATLLQALLTAKGISSSQVLINSGDAYALPKVPGQSVFNHAINYIPEFDLYLDSTAQTLPFGALSAGEYDKPVVLTAFGKLARTPVARAEDHQLIVNTTLEMQSDGRIKGRSHVTGSGDEENKLRLTYHYYAPLAREKTVNDILLENGETGTGDFNTSDPLDLSAPFSVDSEFLLDAPANVPGPSGIITPRGITPGRLYSISQFKLPEERHFPRECISISVQENTTLAFPAGIRVESIPGNTKIERPGISYRASYLLKNNTVSIHRSFVRQNAHGNCETAMHESDRQFLEEIKRDLRAQIVFR